MNSPKNLTDSFADYWQSSIGAVIVVVSILGILSITVLTVVLLVKRSNAKSWLAKEKERVSELKRKSISRRPKSVSVIAWVLIVACSAYCIYLMSNLYRDTPSIINLVSSAVCIISGIAMLNGRNWGRLLYLYYRPIAIVYGFLRKPDFEVIPKVVIYIVFLFFLTRPSASLFFDRQSS